MEELKVEYIPFASLKPSRFNSNTHSDEQVEQIAASIKQFGFNMPIAIDEKKNIIAGEGRYLAAKRLNRREVPVVFLKHLSEAQKRAYIIADNQIARNSTWDEKKLQGEIQALLNQDFSISTLGFSNEELDKIIRAGLSQKETTPVTGYNRKKNNQQTADTSTRRYAVLVYCENETDQEQVLGQLSDQGFECKTHTEIIK